MNATRDYLPNLDATRFLAFICVFFAHAFVGLEDCHETFAVQVVKKAQQLGFLGLEYFFVLSSFLISWLILKERKATGDFKAGPFLIRRILRVWPLYFLIVLIGYVGVPLVQSIIEAPSSELPNIWWHLGFVVNFYIIENGPDYLLLLTFLWSISIEEQFYLLWAGVMKVIKKGFPIVCLILIIISLIFRYIYVDDSRMIYYHTLSTLGNFGVGGLAAWWVHWNGITSGQKLFPKFVSACPYVLFAFFYLYYDHLFSVPRGIIIERLLFSFIFAWIILDQGFNSQRIASIGASKILDYLGKISYGLYCFHGVVITVLIIVIRKYEWAQEDWMRLSLNPLIVLSSTIVIAHLSYRFFERYFLRLKQRFYPEVEEADT